MTDRSINQSVSQSATSVGGEPANRDLVVSLLTDGDWPLPAESIDSVLASPNATVERVCHVLEHVRRHRSRISVPQGFIEWAIVNYADARLDQRILADAESAVADERLAQAQADQRARADAEQQRLEAERRRDAHLVAVLSDERVRAYFDAYLATFSGAARAFMAKLDPRGPQLRGQIARLARADGHDEAEPSDERARARAPP